MTERHTMYNAPKFSQGLVAVLARSSSGAERVTEAARRLSKGGDFVLILKPTEGIEDRLLPAYINATIRKAGGTMRARTLSLEMLLFISGTMNIGNAIERSGARGDEFVVFCSGKPLCDRIVSGFGLDVVKRLSLRLDFSRSGEMVLFTHP